MPTLNPTHKGYIQGTVDTTQAAARDEASGTHIDATGVETSAIQWFRSSGRGGGTMRYTRTFLCFDTSGITSTVSSCTLNVAGGGTYETGDVQCVKSDAFGGDGATNLHDDDFNNVNFSAVYSSSFGGITWDMDGNNAFTLNSSALTSMKNNDVLIMALIEADSDFPDTDTGDGNWTASIDFGGTIQLDYTLATTGYGHVVNGVAAANIGKVDGVATANISKVIGV